MKAHEWLSVLQPVKAVSDTAVLEVDGKASITAVDSAHVALIHAEFDSLPGLEGVHGIDIDKLVMYMKHFDKYDEVEIEKDGGTLIVRGGTMEWRTKIIDTPAIPKIPSLSFPVEIKVFRELLELAIKAANTLATDSVQLKTAPGVFEMHAFDDEDIVSFNTEVDTDAEHKAIYPLNYLRWLVGHIADYDVSIAFDTDYPLKLRWSVLNGRGEVEYLLAPRIEGD